MFLPQETIRKKRDRQKLSDTEIRQFVLGITRGLVSQGQIGAFTMAIYLNGMTSVEQAALTTAMRDSGTVLNWDCLPSDSKIIEKHSSGGVGDEKVTLIVTPIVAACGVFAPNISGRSLGHTGGELDLLESIPGYNIQPSPELFQSTVRRVGTAIIGPTDQLAPADRAIFHVRDVTSTVECIPLIVSSILSKKLAAGARGLVMTVPFGTGAFMRREEDAAKLAKALVDVAQQAHLPMVALISDLEQVLGDSVGNALQIREVIAFLGGGLQEPRLRAVVFAICAEILLLTDLAPTLAAAEQLVEAQLNNRQGAAKFAAMVAALGGPADLLVNPNSYLERAQVIAPVYSYEPGYIASMDCHKIGMTLVRLGAGRAQPEDKIDFAVGISNVAHVGDIVNEARPLCLLHAQDQDQWNEAACDLRGAYTLSATAPAIDPVMRQRFVSHPGIQLEK